MTEKVDDEKELLRYGLHTNKTVCRFCQKPGYVLLISKEGPAHAECAAKEAAGK